jgi:hypothetical protein
LCSSAFDNPSFGSVDNKTLKIKGYLDENENPVAQNTIGKNPIVVTRHSATRLEKPYCCRATLRDMIGNNPIVVAQLCATRLEKILLLSRDFAQHDWKKPYCCRATLRNTIGKNPIAVARQQFCLSCK